MLPGMDGSPANEKPDRSSGLAREDRASFTGGFSRQCRQDAAVDKALAHFPACSGCSDPRCTHCNGILCRKCTITPPAWRFFLLELPDHASILCCCQPQAQTSQIFLPMLVRHRTCMSCSTEQLPCPFSRSREASLELCLGQGCFHCSKYASLRRFLQSDNT